MLQKIVAGIIGAGRIGKIHAENIMNHIENAYIKTIADIKIDHLKKWAENLRISHLTTDYREILEDPEIQVVIICSSTDTHVKFITEAAKAGKHIFCEKPIDFEVSRIKDALNAVKDAGVKFMIGFNRRFDHNFQRMKKAVQKGDLGEPHIIKISSRDPNPPPIEYLKVSGGLFFDMAIHDWDMCRYLSNSEIAEVYAQGAAFNDPEISNINDIDTAVTLLKSKSGIMFIIDNSRKAVYGYDQRVEIFGSKGMILNYNDTINNVEIYSENSIARDKIPYFFLERYRDSYIVEMRELFECVQNNSDPSVSGVDGLQAVLIAKAASLSMRENRPVKLSEIEDS
ncbi:MAG: inositol 2-dehydrogenase [Candidatus Lokiarchaeota archaeon]|nr:inositol 2-dehydrogenase [Candidatus Lokiarchaeota archaeon]